MKQAYHYVDVDSFVFNVKILQGLVDVREPDNAFYEEG